MKIMSVRPRRRARIEIVPLIDIIFFLLATFVLVSLSMVKSKGIAVNLPSASSGENQERKDFASITVTAEGGIFFDKERISQDELPARVAALKAALKDPKIFINSDAEADFGHAVAVLDAVRKGGITKVAIETKPF